MLYVIQISYDVDILDIIYGTKIMVVIYISDK